MKLINKLFSLILMLTLVFSLSGCVEESHTIEINPQGGKATQEQIITKETYEELVSMGINFESLKKEGYVSENFEEDGTEYIKATKSLEFKSINELERYFEELATSSEGADSEKYFKTLDIECKGNNIKISGKIGNPDAATAYTSCTITLKFNNKITKHTIGKKVDSKTLELDLLELWEEKPNTEFTISANENLINVWLIMGIIALTIIIITGVFLFKKQKKRPTEQW